MAHDDICHKPAPVCKHGVPLISTVGGPSSYCKPCSEAFDKDPLYYTYGLHLLPLSCDR